MSKPGLKTIEFKVIAGSLKGRRIVVPDLGVTRPPLARLRKSIFDYLNPQLDGAAYLDLFSGTGSYLFEAVSRGALSATGVEIEARLTRAINDQAQRLGVAERLECRCEDVFEALPRLCQAGRRYHLIMTAPPQYRGFIDRTLKLLASHELLLPDGRIICQHDTSETRKVDWDNFPVIQRREYGNTTFTILGRL